MLLKSRIFYLISGVGAIEGAHSLLQSVAVGSSVLVSKLKHLFQRIKKKILSSDLGVKKAIENDNLD